MSIRTIEITNEESGDIYYPYTSADVVLTDNGQSLSEKLDTVMSIINFKKNNKKFLSKFYKDVLMRTKGLKIQLLGDSMLYGYDNVSSDKKAPVTWTTDSGRIFNESRASKTIPETLQEKLDYLYGSGMFSIENCGVPSDWVSLGFQHWYKNHNANLCVMMYGINDAVKTICPYVGDISQFIDEYSKLIIRQIIFGSACILITPPLTRLDNSNYPLFEKYRMAVYQLGEEFGCPVIDGSIIMQGYGADYYSDATHYNGNGYEIFGANLSNIFIGDILNPCKIFGNTNFLTVDRGLNSIIYDTGCNKVNNSNIPTTDSEIVGQGYALIVPPTKKVTYSIYCEDNNNIVIPSFYASDLTGNIKVDIDYGLDQRKFNFDYLRDNIINKGVPRKEASSITIPTSILRTEKISYKHIFKYNGLRPLVITGKGYHTITVTNSTNADIVFYGLFIEEYKRFYSDSKIFIKGTSTNPRSTESIAETRISIMELTNTLGLYGEQAEFFNSPMLNIGIMTGGTVLDNYLIQTTLCESFPTSIPNGVIFYGLIGSTLSADKTMSTTGKRILTNVTLDKDKGELILAWGGDLTKYASINITYANSSFNVRVYNPLTFVPNPIKGGVYMNNLGEWYRCSDGVTWMKF